MWDLSSLTRDWTRVPCIGRWILNHWTTREVPLHYFLCCVLAALYYNHILISWWTCVIHFSCPASKHFLMFREFLFYRKQSLPPSVEIKPAKFLLSHLAFQLGFNKYMLNQIFWLFKFFKILYNSSRVMVRLEYNIEMISMLKAKILIYRKIKCVKHIFVCIKNVWIFLNSLIFENLF